MSQVNRANESKGRFGKDSDPWTRVNEQEESMGSRPFSMCYHHGSDPHLADVIGSRLDLCLLQFAFAHLS